MAIGGPASGFAGIGLGFESISADRPGTSDSESDSALWFVLDAGLGAWIRITGPVDLVLRLEFDLPPTSENVPFFMVGEAGLQIAF